MNGKTISLYATTIGFVALLTTLAVQELYADDLVVSAATCSAATLKGSFGVNRTGDTLDGPLAAVGRVTIDENGNFTLKQQISRNGDFQSSKVTGQFQIAKDCTFKVFDSGGGQFGSGIVVDDGNGFFVLNRTPGNSVVTLGRKIHSN